MMPLEIKQATKEPPDHTENTQFLLLRFALIDKR